MTTLFVRHKVQDFTKWKAVLGTFSTAKEHPMPLGRLLVLIIAFGLMLWFFVLPSINEPGTRGPAVAPQATESTEAGERDTWTREERAAWREQVDQRLYRR